MSHESTSHKPISLVLYVFTFFFLEPHTFPAKSPSSLHASPARGELARRRLWGQRPCTSRLLSPHPGAACIYHSLHALPAYGGSSNVFSCRSLNQQLCEFLIQLFAIGKPALQFVCLVNILTDHFIAILFFFVFR